VRRSNEFRLIDERAHRNRYAMFVRSPIGSKESLEQTIYAVWVGQIEHYRQVARHGSSVVKKRELHDAQALHAFSINEKAATPTACGGVSHWGDRPTFAHKGAEQPGLCMRLARL
jgi:hypothetical protein